MKPLFLSIHRSRPACHLTLPASLTEATRAASPNAAYVTAFFTPRQAGDRPDVVPAGAVNFAFIGQFAESRERDCIFTTEYSVRTPMEAVYTLLNVERGVPEVFNSTYDIRSLLGATGRLRDGKELDIPGPEFLRNLLMNKLDQTQIGALLREYGLVTGD